MNDTTAFKAAEALEQNAVALAVLIKREACAKVCEHGADPDHSSEWARALNNACRTRAVAIRARYKPTTTKG